jgi:hypothetical protein
MDIVVAPKCSLGRLYPSSSRQQRDSSGANSLYAAITHRAHRATPVGGVPRAKLYSDFAAIATLSDGAMSLGKNPG